MKVDCKLFAHFVIYLYENLSALFSAGKVGGG